MKRLIIIMLAILAALSLKAQQLYIGANYTAHDVPQEQWARDIALMKEAGFNVTRLSHLAWDSLEATEGQFTFEWLDKVMDQMAAAGIKVILDIPVRPAPIWLQLKYPSISITDASGDLLYPNRRYMEDVGDPDYQRYALRLTDMMTKRYARHPAVLAFGIDNESGDGPISYSESVRVRFCDWLEKKYGTTEKLNVAWAGQRWSRKIGKFSEVGLPQSGSYAGQPERVLDFRRFLSDEINGFLFKVIDLANRNAPGVPTNTNAWYYSRKYYDFVPMMYSGKLTHGGAGFYPGGSLLSNKALCRSLFGIARINFENPNPFWCSEFATMNSTPGAIRKYAYSTLMYGNQMVCGWVWQTMFAGEEQFHLGMMDWDGHLNRKYYEYKQISQEFKKIEKYFPYKLKAEVGLAYSFDSQMTSLSYPVQHDAQLRTTFDLFTKKNMDVRMLDLVRSDLDYKLLLVPGMALMDKRSADKIRDYVKRGGTVIMTASSAVHNETGQVFATEQPGYLSDVFGIRLEAYELTENMNEVSRLDYAADDLLLDYKGRSIKTKGERYDLVEPQGAEVLGKLVSLDKDYPIVTSHRYGKGQAIYIGLAASEEVLTPIVEELIKTLSISEGPDVPDGVMARRIDENHLLLLNITSEEKQVSVQGAAHSLLSGNKYLGSVPVAPQEPEFIEIRSR